MIQIRLVCRRERHGDYADEVAGGGREAAGRAKAGTKCVH